MYFKNTYSLDTHWCLALGRTLLDTIDPWPMSLAPTNEDSVWLAEVKPIREKITFCRVRFDNLYV